MALWPTWWWMGHRMVDNSDDPLGLLALAALAVLLLGSSVCARHRAGFGWRRWSAPD
ncbi:MAG: hypothetical protein IPO19_15145 [Rhodoferax sp.]|nr:hypothetical protein [Rhodoferax sp.]